METEAVHPLSADVFPFPGAWGADYLSLRLGRDLLWCVGLLLLLWLLDWVSERTRSGEPSVPMPESHAFFDHGR